ncbi:MAG: hypothetical protein K6U74_02710, partial [Firmicutes bacterium]|nr:hypothetical protein [Bacillota bacterium]
YSWSAHGQPWTAHQWLWEVLMHLAYEKIGVIGLWSLAFVCAAATGLLVRAGAKAGKAASVAGGAAPLLLVDWLKPWPQIAVYALFSVYLYLSLRGRWGGREITAVAVVGLVWANVHSSAVMLPLLLLAEAGWRVITREGGFKPLLIASLASALATLINPHGTGLWAYAVREGLLTGEYKTYIAEWMPFFFGSTGMAISFFICAGILLFSAHNSKAKSLEFARAAGFWALALLSRIYMPYAVLSTAALLGTLEIKFSKDFIMKLTAVPLIAAVFVLGIRGVPTDLDAAAGKSRYPVRAVEFLQEQNYGKLFNDYAWGGYLIWKGAPVYIDGRADLYRHRNIFGRYIKLSESGEQVSYYIGRTGADAALVVKNSLMDAALRESPGWKCVYMDDTAVVYRPVR